MMLGIRAAITAVTMGAGVIAAPGQTPAPAASECNGSTTREQDQCFAAQYKQADAALNQVYQQLMAKLDPDDETLLRAAEQAWIAFRDKECAFETSGTRNGTIHPIVVSICLTEKTQAHLAELQKQLNCPEGDTGCGH